jgi:hypothetical protein
MFSTTCGTYSPRVICFDHVNTGVAAPVASSCTHAKGMQLQLQEALLSPPGRLCSKRTLRKDSAHGAACRPTRLFAGVLAACAICCGSAGVAAPL